MNKKNGIIAAGNWLVDHIKIIDVYPEQSSLANIKSEKLNNGGGPFNVLKDLARMGADFPLKAIGILGNDSNGKWIQNECIENNIDISNLKVVENVSTSFSDVMTVESTGRRTFFHQRGASVLLDTEHFNFDQYNEKIFYLGYLLLLDKLDKLDSNNLTGAAKVLCSAQENGLITSVDIVSEDSNRFKDVVIPSLPFIDYLFINEFEAERTTGIELDSNNLQISSLRQAAKKLLDWGVRNWVFLHFPLGVYARNNNGDEILQGSIKYPKNKIKSTVGAGDALAAGTLFAIHENMSMEATLKFGVAAAAASLQDVSCSNGINHYKDNLSIAEQYSYYELEKVLKK